MAVTAIVWVLVGVSFALAIQLPIRVTTAAWPAHVPKAAAQALSTYLLLAGLVGAVIATATLFRQPSAGMVIAAALGVAVALLSGAYIQQVRAPNNALTTAFGSNWQQSIPAQRAEGMLSQRWRWALPSGAAPRWDRDVVYAELPDSDRELLADVWQPPAGVTPTGLGLVYVHGGYYQMLDKDTGTRPLFRHLTRQGHVIVDISYRLVDETGIVGMVGDVKRAVAWLERHAATFGVDPEKIVLAGASSGGNLALLAGYTPNHPELTPDELAGDTSVRAVVAYYGVHDWPSLAQLSPENDLTARLFDGNLEQVSEHYALASPITHAGPDSPATLLVQGQHDVPHLVDANRALAQVLGAAGVRVASIELPATDHAFDLMPPGLGPHSPPSIAALYDLERFLTVLAHEPP